MEIHKETKLELTWHFNGKWHVIIVNGVVTELNFCELGTGTECEKCLKSTDIQFLQNVHTALGELFKKMDEENKANGYSFPKDKVENN